MKGKGDCMTRRRKQRRTAKQKAATRKMIAANRKMRSNRRAKTKSMKRAGGYAGRNLIMMRRAAAQHL
jgi:hypothetical protein